MPKLTDIRKLVKVVLPSFEGSEIMIYDGMRFGDLTELDKAKTDMERGLIALQLLIKDWNFTDENDKKLEVTVENLKLLPFKDLTLLLEKISGFFTKLKKESVKPSKD